MSALRLCLPLLFHTFFCFSESHPRYFILAYPPVTIFFSSAESNLLLLSHVEFSISNTSSNFIILKILRIVRVTRLSPNPQSGLRTPWKDSYFNHYVWLLNYLRPWGSFPVVYFFVVVLSFHMTCSFNWGLCIAHKNLKILDLLRCQYTADSNL